MFIKLGGNGYEGIKLRLFRAKILMHCENIRVMASIYSVVVMVVVIWEAGGPQICAYQGMVRSAPFMHTCVFS